MNLIVAKIVSLVAIASVSMLCGMFPYYLVKWFNSRGIFNTKKVRIFISAVICFSGGTLIGVAFLHLMPEMREKLESLQEHGFTLSSNPSLPISDILTCCGFFFVYIFDETMHLFIEWYTRRQSKKKPSSEIPHEAGLVSLDGHVSRSHRLTRLRGTCLPCICMATSRHRMHHLEGHGHREGPDPIQAAQLAQQAPSADKMAERPTSDNLSVHTDGHASVESQQVVRGSPVAVNPLSGLITILALSFHDIFEGIAIGIEEDVQAVLFLYISIAAHKYAIAFCIGMDLVLSSTKMAVIVLYMVTYSIVSPIGILIGMTVFAGDARDGAAVDTPVTVVLQGLAGGTLIYVVCFEVLQRESSETHVKGILNVFFVLIGFSLTLVFKVFFAHEHNHNHDHDHHHDHTAESHNHTTEHPH